MPCGDCGCRWRPTLPERGPLDLRARQGVALWATSGAAFRGRTANLRPIAEVPESVRGLERAAWATLVSRQPAVHGAGTIIESMIVPPGGVNWHGTYVPEGTWVGAVQFSDAGWRNARDLLKPGSDVTTNEGGGAMDTRDKTFSDAVRATVPQATHEVVDAELVRVVRQAVDEALRPLLFQMQEIDARIRRAITGIRQPEDTFGAAVRGGPLTAAEKADAAKRRERDPFGAAVMEKREPLTLGQGHRFLRDKRRR